MKDNRIILFAFSFSFLSGTQPSRCNFEFGKYCAENRTKPCKNEKMKKKQTPIICYK